MSDSIFITSYAPRCFYGNAKLKSPKAELAKSSRVDRMSIQVVTSRSELKPVTLTPITSADVGAVMREYFDLHRLEWQKTHRNMFVVITPDLQVFFAKNPKRLQGVVEGVPAKRIFVAKLNPSHSSWKRKYAHDKGI